MVKIEFVSTEQGETADVLVCMSWTDPPILRDNLQAECGICGHLVQHRPNAPKKPMKVCVGCAPTVIRGQ